MAIALAVCIITFFHPASPVPLLPFTFLGPLCLLLVLVRALAYWPPMNHFVASMPIPHRIVFVVLLYAMMLGHYTLNGRTYFPFVVWEIFPSYREVDPVTCREFIATTADEAKVRLIPEQLVPSIVQLDRLDTLPPETTEALARALAKIYNDHHPANPVRAVDLYLMAVQLHPPANESRAQPSCELLSHYDISSGP